MKNLLYGTLFLALVGIAFVGCEKATNIPTPVVKSVQIPDSDKELIEKNALIYRQSFEEVLLNRGTLNGDELTEKVGQLYEQKAKDLIKTIDEDVINAHKGARISSSLSEEKINGYLDNLFQKMSNPYSDEDVSKTKHEVLSDMQLILENTISEVSLDESLSENDRIIVMENMMVYSSYFLINIEFADLIYYTDEDNSARKRSWWKRNRAKIKCAKLSALALATCGITAVGVVTNPYASVLFSYSCLHYALSAVNCWNNL